MMPGPRHMNLLLPIGAAPPPPPGTPDHRRRALASAALAATALERDLPRAAMVAARSAARSALLALGAAPRRCQVPELGLLRAMAASTPWLPACRDGGQPAALLRDTVLAVERLLAPLPAAHGGRPAAAR